MYASAEWGRYTHLISSRPIYVLCGSERVGITVYLSVVSRHRYKQQNNNLLLLWFLTPTSWWWVERDVRTQNTLLKEQSQYTALLCDVLALVSPSPLRAKRVEEESCVQSSLRCILIHRGDKGRGETEGVSLPAQLERTPQLGSWWLHWVHLLLCPSKIFRHWNKNTFVALDGM